MVYWPVLHHDFVILDDQAYITDNPHVQSGLTAAGLAWAFQIGYAAYWHPLTWISHMLDCQLYGLHPAGHHLTSLLFHIANTLLLFAWLNQLTGAVWRSAFVAAFFAWHPLHVESVAWACERKDVLSAFFWMLALIAYTRYAQRVTSDEWRMTRTGTSPSLAYALALFFFACGLMSKPMVVTLPFVMLLLDFWPLNRSSAFRVQGSESKDPGQLRPTAWLILEKLPFFVLAAAGCVVTYFAQRSGGAVWSEGLPLRLRLANALVSYLRYISKTFWPVDLAVVYPYPHHWPVALVAAAALLLLLWTGCFLWRAGRNPALLFGWLWFLGTLVPVIGIVQVGPQSMADRFTYLPGIGLFLLVVWGLSGWAALHPARQAAVVAAGTLALAGCLAGTAIQLSYWQNSIVLLRHAGLVTRDNYIADNVLGRALDDAGKRDESLPLYEEAVRLEPHYAQAQFNLGIARLNRRQWDQACEHLRMAAQLVPEDPGARYYLGAALLKAGKLNEAADQLIEAIRLAPGLAAAHYELAQTLQQQNQLEDAVRQYRETLRLDPQFHEAKTALEGILAAHPELR